MKKLPKIGLDIDGVLADFSLAWHKLYPEISPRPNTWFWDDKISERFATMRSNGTLDEFYLNIEPLLKPEDIPFKPHCYITSRPVSKEISELWLEKHGFPRARVISLNLGTSKVEAAKKAGVDIFVDDFYMNFVELNAAHILTYLYTQPWNVMYDVGDLRIDSLNDLSILKLI